VAKKKTLFDDRPVEINEVRPGPAALREHTSIDPCKLTRYS